MSEDFSGLFGSETEVVTLAPGEALFEKGQPGRLMYVVKSGNLQTTSAPRMPSTHTEFWPCARFGARLWE